MTAAEAEALAPAALLVVPPFAPLFQPSIACHLLQACARRAGFEVAVHYANLQFASLIGTRRYKELLAERLRLEHIFREAAFGPDAERDRYLDESIALRMARAEVESFLAQFEERFRATGPRIVGSTCSFEQISSSLAILRRCKSADPAVTTLIGGANCEGEMATGILSLSDAVDHVVSGEAESAFPDLVERLLAGDRPDAIVRGQPCEDLDRLPEPSYDEYFEQLDEFLPGERRAGIDVGVPFESSRGCWWGVKHHCTFCGLNGEGIAFREKSPKLAADQIRRLVETYPVRRVNTVDNIMPHRYFTTMLPILAASLEDDVVIFYEQKANIDLRRAVALKEARVTEVQAGIEALDSHLLDCMDKGVSAYQNVALLRYGRSLGIDVSWNMLGGIPGDKREDYEATLHLIERIPHLQPPDGLDIVRIDRFSPYYDRPADFGIENLRPKSVYQEVFPASADLERLAYFFDGDYRCEGLENPELLDQIASVVGEWYARWQRRPRPILSIVHLHGDEFAVIDHRGEAGEQRFDVVDRPTARLLLTGAKLQKRDELEWAIERDFLIELDGRLVALATAPQDVLVDLVGGLTADSAPAPTAVEITAR